MKSSFTKFISNKRVLFAILVLLLSTTTLSTSAQTETLGTGAYIINMGVVPQTRNNALKPYGLVYDLLKNYNVQIKWVINQTKVKDGADFTYNGVQYKGGTFIIPAQYRTAAVNSRISFFGVTGSTTTSALTVNVTYTLTTAPKWTLDFQNGDIAADFFTDAGIPSSAYDTKTPAQLNGCDEIYVMPHADADWSYYGPLRNWILNFRGSFWGGCRTGSQIENLFNPANPSQQMNFLSNNVGAAGNALVPYDDHNDGTPPYIHQFPTSPVAQYMGITDDAHQNGSEQIYLPKLNGSWRPTTQVIAYDPTQSNVPSLSPGLASAIVFGRAYGNPLSGLVMYEGGHNIGGTSVEEIAAQRAFWNFSFLSSTEAVPGGCGGSIGDRVWLDANGNGIQDATETTGISGITVQLGNSSGAVIATTNTNASGNYLFSQLVAGTYTVAFPVSISGAVVTSANVGTNDDIDSDPNQTTGIIPNIVLAAGQAIVNVDAGYSPVNLQLGSRVWYDTNNNGINDAAENGIRNVTVRLYKDDNNDNVADAAALATLVTDVNGNYLFGNLSPGNYIVGAVVPNGYVSSSINGSDPDNNIDLDDNGQVAAVGNEIRGLAITLTGGAEPTSGNTNNTYDFGMLPDCACVNSTSNLLVNPSFENGTTGWNWSGGTLTTGTGYIACGTANGFNNWSSGTSRVWQDVNVAAGSTVSFSAFAGTHTPGIACSPRLSLIFLNSANAVIGQTDVTVTRDVDINNSQLEQYSITAVAPSGTVKARVQSSITCNTMKMDAFCLTVTIPPASIGDFVFNDINGNGIQDAGELGIANATVTLTYPNSTTVTTTTNASGIYSFTNLAPGTYSLAFTTPAGFTPTASNVGANDTVDSDPVSGVVTGIVLTAGQVNNTVDAGFYQANLTLGNAVWYDQNNDGIKQAIETGIVGATVNLYADANNDNVADGAAIATTTTIAGGAYGFANLAPGNYIVGVIIPTGYAVVTTNGGDPDNDTDNDNNGTNTNVAGEVRSSAVSLTTGGEPATAVDGDGTNGNLTVDFGLRGTGALGNYVWDDLNRNGIQDAVEPGIVSATVTLTYPNGTTAIKTTSTGGLYSFTDLMPGLYSVAFTTPTGFYVPTGSNVGTDDGLDSDPVSGVVSNINIAAGQTDNTIDAGFYRVLTIQGNVWHDVNGMDDNLVNNTGPLQIPAAATIPVGLRVIRVNANTGLVVSNGSVLPNGTFSFGNVAPGTYILILSQVPGTPGQPPPFAGLPPSWVNTGERLGLNPGRDAVIDGRLGVNVVTTNVINANFAIKLSNADGGID